ncbi:Hypothetical protein SSCIU_01203 [Mammaliicoccus sciuri]|nr:Hypothetical protein SSCIU_01203 [Mammaliicoccus sciuri]
MRERYEQFGLELQITVPVLALLMRTANNGILNYKTHKKCNY